MSAHGPFDPGMVEAIASWVRIDAVLDPFIDRFHNLEQDRRYLEQIRENTNCLIPEKVYQKRMAQGLWTPETVGS